MSEITQTEKEQVLVDFHLFEAIFKQVEGQTEFTTPLSKQVAHMIAIVCDEMKERLYNVYVGDDSIDMLCKEDSGDMSWLYSDKMRSTHHEGMGRSPKLHVDGPR